MVVDGSITVFLNVAPGHTLPCADVLSEINTGKSDRNLSYQHLIGKIQQFIHGINAQLRSR